MKMLWNYLRVCHVCQAYEFQSTSLLCQTCREKLFTESRMSAKELYLELGFPSYTWCHWTEGNNPLLRPIIYALKGGYLQTALFEFCIEASYELTEIFTNKPLLVPAPAQNKKQLDHAGVIAQSMAKIFDLKVIGAFDRRNPKTLQKTKSKQQRQQSNLKLSSNLSLEDKKLLLRNEHPLIFIDDLITTGSTAKHAFTTLNKPYKFSSFSLFYRPLKYEDS